MNDLARLSFDCRAKLSLSARRIDRRTSGGRSGGLWRLGTERPVNSLKSSNLPEQPTRTSETIPNSQESTKNTGFRAIGRCDFESWGVHFRTADPVGVPLTNIYFLLPILYLTSRQKMFRSTGGRDGVRLGSRDLKEGLCLLAWDARREIIGSAKSRRRFN